LLANAEKAENLLDHCLDQLPPRDRGYDVRNALPLMLYPHQDERIVGKEHKELIVKASKLSSSKGPWRLANRGIGLPCGAACAACDVYDERPIDVTDLYQLTIYALAEDPAPSAFAWYPATRRENAWLPPMAGDGLVYSFHDGRNRSMRVTFRPVSLRDVAKYSLKIRLKFDQ